MPLRAKDASCCSELEEAGRLHPPGPKGPLPTDTCIPAPWYRVWTSASRTVVLPVRLIYRKLVRHGLNNPRAQRLNRQSVILAWGLWAGQSAQLTRPGSQGAGRSHLHLPPGTVGLAWGMRSVQEERRELCDA